MTNIEQIQNRILEQMQEILSNEQLQKLENVMAIEFHGIEVQAGMYSAGNIREPLGKSSPNVYCQ